MYSVKRIWPWLLLWGVLDLLCALFCEIHADEAYYRLYGQFLNWGYFDHPPMVGLMTAVSAALIPATSLILKNLSVRLVTVLLHVVTVWVLWRTILDFRFNISDFKSQTDLLWRFLLVAASIPMFCAYGFITTPDAPLLFFAAVFYYAYRRYLRQESGDKRQEFGTILLLGISMAGMLYSKYIAVLVIAFALLGNLRLLRDGKAWAAVGIAVVLMIPHLYWQYANHFPSFTYHLVSRATSYEPLYSMEYLPNQWSVFNPLVWALMLWVGARQIRHGDAFNRSMGMTVWGFQVFFFIMTCRGHVEPHWTVVTAIPAVIMLTEDTAIWKRGVRIAMVCFVGLILVSHVILMLNVLPVRTGLAGKQAQMDAIHAEANDLPVVFDGSFQTPSLYRFFYDDKAVLVRNAGDRYTQFDLWHLEREFMGQPACVRRHGTVYITECLSEEDLRE